MRINCTSLKSCIFSSAIPVMSYISFVYIYFCRLDSSWEVSLQYERGFMNMPGEAPASNTTQLGIAQTILTTVYSVAFIGVLLIQH
ncbi:hypothetical protein Y1Q_0017534 [Alligator mississippiensis]|uniref:Uncharacterized protein n=1 Tax=Alligator mississippiensis TaxID=8496 RepID=A0A151P2I5_ALLMI|nr:hypothetical protein Y1Q_0017534 [Alligator mississippiensis]